MLTSSNNTLSFTGTGDPATPSAWSGFLLLGGNNCSFDGTARELSVTGTFEESQ